MMTKTEVDEVAAVVEAVALAALDQVAGETTAWLLLLEQQPVLVPPVKAVPTMPTFW